MKGYVQVDRAAWEELCDRKRLSLEAQAVLHWLVLLAGHRTAERTGLSLGELAGRVGCRRHRLRPVLDELARANAIVDDFGRGRPGAFRVLVYADLVVLSDAEKATIETHHAATLGRFRAQGPGHSRGASGTPSQDLGSKTDPRSAPTLGAKPTQAPGQMPMSPRGTSPDAGTRDTLAPEVVARHAERGEASAHAGAERPAPDPGRSGPASRDPATPTRSVAGAEIDDAPTGVVPEARAAAPPPRGSGVALAAVGAPQVAGATPDPSAAGLDQRVARELPESTEKPEPTAAHPPGFADQNIEGAR